MARVCLCMCALVMLGCLCVFTRAKHLLPSDWLHQTALMIYIRGPVQSELLCGVSIYYLVSVSLIIVHNHTNSELFVNRSKVDHIVSVLTFVVFFTYHVFIIIVFAASLIDGKTRFPSANQIINGMAWLKSGDFFLIIEICCNNSILYSCTRLLPFGCSSSSFSVTDE